MSSYEEAEVMRKGGVIIRYYYGKTVLIPSEVMKREAIQLTKANDLTPAEKEKPKIALRPRRFLDGGF